MKIIVHEMYGTSLEQTITPTKNSLVEAIRPHIYISSLASGSLYMQITNSLDEVLATSDTVNITDITTANYYHGYVRFYINFYMKANTTYKVKLVSNGITYTTANYVGWANSYDLNKYPIGYTPGTSDRYPLDMEIWTRKP